MNPIDIPSLRGQIPRREVLVERDHSCRCSPCRLNQKLPGDRLSQNQHPSDRPHSIRGNKHAVSNNDNHSRYYDLTLSGAWIFALV